MEPETIEAVGDTTLAVWAVVGPVASALAASVLTLRGQRKIEDAKAVDARRAALVEANRDEYREILVEVAPLYLQVRQYHTEVYIFLPRHHGRITDDHNKDNPYRDVHRHSFELDDVASSLRTRASVIRGTAHPAVADALEVLANAIGHPPAPDPAPSSQVPISMVDLPEVKALFDFPPYQAHALMVQQRENVRTAITHLQAIIHAVITDRALPEKPRIQPLAYEDWMYEYSRAALDEDSSD